MDINGRRIREQDLAHPNRRGWVILLYLILHKAPVDQLSMATELWPDEPEKSARANIRQAIYRLHSDLAVYHDAKVIDVKSGMLELLDDVQIVTDAEEMIYLGPAEMRMRVACLLQQALSFAWNLSAG